jgi:hypothetical protein
MSQQLAHRLMHAATLLAMRDCAENDSRACSSTRLQTRSPEISVTTWSELKTLVVGRTIAARESPDVKSLEGGSLVAFVGIFSRVRDLDRFADH